MTELDRDALAPRNLSRVVVGLAVQPLVAGLLGFVTFPALEYMNRTQRRALPTDSFDAAISVAFAAAIVACVITVVGAFPIVAWRLGRGRFTLPEVSSGAPCSAMCR